MTQPEAPDTHHSDPPSGATGGYRPGDEIAAERILEYIAAERLRPGDRLPTEKDLADAVQMTRTVVREAVKILSALGRISVQKGRGIYVAEPGTALWRESNSQFLPTDLHQVDEMFEFRRFTEITTARLAAQRATPTQVRHSARPHNRPPTRPKPTTSTPSTGPTNSSTALSVRRRPTCPCPPASTPSNDSNCKSASSAWPAPRPAEPRSPPNNTSPSPKPSRTATTTTPPS